MKKIQFLIETQPYPEKSDLNKLESVDPYTKASVLFFLKIFFLNANKFSIMLNYLDLKQNLNN